MGTPRLALPPTRLPPGMGSLTASSRRLTDSGSIPLKSTCPTTCPSTASWVCRPQKRLGASPLTTATSSLTGTLATLTQHLFPNQKSVSNPEVLSNLPAAQKTKQFLYSSLFAQTFQ